MAFNGHSLQYTNQPRMLINVQFLRVVAAMLVVFYHTSAHVRDSGMDQGMFFALSEAIGFAGVDIFFVISGFIMAHTTHAAAGLEAGWAFARRRIARIYCGYWPFFLLALALFAWSDPARIQSSSLMRSAILWPANELLIAVSWTLIFEMFFYVLYTLLVIFTSRRRNMALQLLLAFIIGWSLFSQFGRHAYDPGHLEYISLAEYYTVSPYLSEFLGGALVAGWLRHHQGGHGLVWLMLGTVLFCGAGWINNHLFGGQLEQGYHVFFRVLAFGVPAVMLVTGLVRLEQAGVRTPMRLSLLAGGASYAIYLSHTLLLTASQHLGLNAFAGQLGASPARLLLALYTLLILLYSIAHYRLLERPLHRAFKQVLGLDRQRATGSDANP